MRPSEFKNGSKCISNHCQVFGEYVRNVIVPKLNAQAITNFNEVNIWFPWEEKVNKFLSDLEFIFKLFCKDYNFLKWENNRYLLTKN